MRTILLSLSILFMAVLASEALAGPKGQEQCPVSNEPINKDIFIDHDGSRIYFCCQGCVDEFKKNPSAYLDRMASEDTPLEKAPIAQTMCPVMNAPMSKDIFVDHDGSRIYLCCQGCVDEFKKDPEKYMKKMADAGVTPQETPVAQTVCPVSGHPITTASFIDHQGSRVYFCGDGCKAAFQKDPGKYSGTDPAAAAPSCGDRSSSKARSCGAMKGCGGTA